MYFLILYLILIINCDNGERKAEKEIFENELKNEKSLSYNMDVYYFPIRALTYFSITSENIEKNAIIKLHLNKNENCYRTIIEQIDSKNYKSNFGVFDQENIRIKIRIRDGIDSSTYLIDRSGAIYTNGKSFKIRNAELFESTIDSCKNNENFIQASHSPLLPSLPLLSCKKSAIADIFPK